jgi:hypothetical protein
MISMANRILLSKEYVDNVGQRIRRLGYKRVSGIAIGVKRVQHRRIGSKEDGGEA